MATYSDLDKDALVEEVKRRRAAGRKVTVDLRAPEDKLRSALEMDDVENGDAPAPLSGSMEDQVPAQPEMPSTPTQPGDDVFAKGFRAKHKADGFVYQVVKLTTDDVRPYKARIPKQKSGHPGLFWEGSEADFTAAFDKV